MRLQCLITPILVCAVLLHVAVADIYLDPSSTNGPETISCATSVSTVCPQAAPCGLPPTTSVVTIAIENTCNVYLAGTHWPVPVVVNASGNGSAIFHQWDPLNNGGSIQNLSLTITSLENVQVTLSSLNATGSVLNVTSPLLTFLNSTFVMDNLSTFPILGVGAQPRLQFNNSNLIKKSGSSPAFSLGYKDNLMPVYHPKLIDITNSTFEMPNVDIFFGETNNLTVDTSTLFGDTLINIVYYLGILDSSLYGFSGGFIPGEGYGAICLGFDARNSTFSGLSPSQPIVLFVDPDVTSSYRALDCIFRWGRNPWFQTVIYVELQGNIFDNFRQSFKVLTYYYAPTSLFIGNTFTREDNLVEYLELTSLTASLVRLSGNRFDSTTSMSSYCDVLLGGVHIEPTSDLKVDKLCTSDSLIEGSLEASSINSLPLDGILVNVTGDVVLPSFNGNASLNFLNSSLTYLITNASIGINISVDQMPRALHLSWREAEPLKVGDEWPLFPKVSTGAVVLPDMLSSDIVTFNYSLLRSCTATGQCHVNFQVAPVLECPCHPEHSLPCNTSYIHPCSCIPPWSGPTCEIDSTPQPCPGLPPSPQFYCQNGEYISNSSVTEQTIVIPAGSGTIVVNGNLTSTQTVVFQGLGSVVNVSGCVFVKGNVVVELSPQDVQELLKDGGTKTIGLITSSGGNTCDESSDLSLVSIVVKSPDKCVKVEASNSGSKQSLSATFRITQSKCSKSHLVAIIVPCVLGAVVIVSVIAVIVFLKIRHNKKL